MSARKKPVVRSQMRREVTIDEYLADASPSSRALLQKLRKTIHTLVPEVEECISYGMPAFRYEGRIVAGFQATAKGCSYYPFSGTTLKTVVDDIEGYSQTKSRSAFRSRQAAARFSRSEAAQGTHRRGRPPVASRRALIRGSSSSASRDGAVSSVRGQDRPALLVYDGRDPETSEVALEGGWAPTSRFNGALRPCAGCSVSRLSSWPASSVTTPARRGAPPRFWPMTLSALWISVVHVFNRLNASIRQVAGAWK